MLTDKFQQLLTAYVDGELSARQRRAVQKLLRKSPEARELLRRLQADSSALINLPPPPHTPDVSGSVLRTIAQRGLRPGGRAIYQPQTISIRTALAAAAGVLLMVGAASFVFFSSLADPGRQDTVAQRKKEPYQASKPDNREKPFKPDDRGTIVQKPEPEKQPKKDRTTDVVTLPEKKPELDKPKVPEKNPEPGVIVTAPSMEVFQPNSADVSVPSLLKLKDLSLETHRQALVKELSQSEAFYVEVLCKEATHAFPRLRDAFKAGKRELIVDPTAVDRLKDSRIKANYGVYLEDITPEELARLLEPLGVDDSKGDKKKPSVGQFLGNDANLILCPMTAEHRKRLANLLGVDVVEAPAKEKQASSGKGPERQAIAMAYVPTAVKTPSPEVKKYLDSRNPARKGTLRVLLVLRGRP